MKTTISTIHSGETVKAGYKQNIDENLFLGFKVEDQLFTNLKQLKQFFEVKNLREIESKLDRVTAEFRNVEDDYLWGAYLWNGAFRVGTSADRLTFVN